MLNWSAVDRALSEDHLLAGGRITRVSGSTLQATLPRAQTGAIYRIEGRDGRRNLLAEVIGFSDVDTILAPFGEARGIGPGDLVVPEGTSDQQLVSEEFLGRSIDPLGAPMDGGPPVHGKHLVPLYRSPPNPLTRQTIDTPLETGVSVIDGPNTVGRGQRMGVFAGPGVGKSTLLGMIARFGTADVNVIALIGERGREVREFIERELGEEGRAKTVLIVATGDAAPILRVRAALLATALAEYFRDHGRHVMLAMDSLTRLAHALREIGLSAGEPPTTRGYPPSVFSTLPKILERAGNAEGPGTMTAFYTVLVDGDDMTEPIADAARSILDGHLVLSRKIAEAGRYPAVDVPGSLSRVASEIIEPHHAMLATQARAVMSSYEEVRELIQVGAYQTGSDPIVDRTVRLFPQVQEVFQQGRNEHRTMSKTLGALGAVLGGDK